MANFYFDVLVRRRNAFKRASVTSGSSVAGGAPAAGGAAVSGGTLGEDSPSKDDAYSGPSVARPSTPTGDGAPSARAAAAPPGHGRYPLTKRFRRMLTSTFLKFGDSVLF